MPVPADATADFYNHLNDPTKWIIRQGVPLFKAHQRTDPATGNQINVDLPKLYRIAANMTRLEREGGVPVRGTLGHTEPGKPETEQPPVATWYRNARVQPFGPSGEPAVVADEWLDPQYAPKRKNYPYRSAEYYDDAEQITGVALLTRDPFLDLGVVAYSRDDRPVTYAAPGPVRYSKNGCVPYLYSLGDEQMNPNGTGTTPPAFVPHPPAAVPVNYGYPGQYSPPPAGYGHQHPGGWNGGAAQYGEPELPPGAANPPPGEDQDELSQLHYHLSQAAQYLGGHLSRRGAKTAYAPEAQGLPPGGPPLGMPGMPPGPGAVPPPPGMPDQPYARYAGYAAPAAPTPYAPAAGTPGPSAVARTISGLPVGYQAELDKLNYQNTELNRAMKVLMYERETADTEACAAEIRRFAQAGYNVGEYEFNELKKKPRGERAAYLNHIATKYASVGVEALPPILNDPTYAAGPAHADNRPASQEEMEAALKLHSQSGGRTDYATALQQVRYGTRPQGQELAGFPEPYEGGGVPAAGAFPQPSLNGHAGPTY